MDEDCHSSSTTNEAQSRLERSIEIVKGIENGCKLTPDDAVDQLSELTRRSYNEHLGSINFINLLDGDSSNETDHLKANIKSYNLVSNVLDSGEEGMHNNDKRTFCLPSRILINKGSTSSFGFKSTALRDQAVPMDIVSQSDFASQTLKPFSTQNLESIALEERQVQGENRKYKLKESSRGCLPGKGKSKKLQKRKENERMNLESEGRGENDEQKLDGESVADNSSDNNCGSGKATRRKSFLSALKFIKLRKFGKKKEQKGQEDFCQASSSSTWESDSAQSSSSEQKHESPYQDDEFVFGGVRVFIDENGECYEVDENVDIESNQSTVPEDDSRSSITSPARKFESRDSLNLGYSGRFVSSEMVDM